MIDKILVAVDGSEHSLKAVDYAASIASAMKSELHILFVLKSQNLPKGLMDYADAEHIAGGNKDILEKWQPILFPAPRTAQPIAALLTL